MTFRLHLYRTDRPPDRPTEGRTDGRTDAFYGRSHGAHLLFPYSPPLPCTVKQIRMSTDILWRVFRILTEPVPYTSVSANRRNNEARGPLCPQSWTPTVINRPQSSVDVESTRRHPPSSPGYRLFAQDEYGEFVTSTVVYCRRLRQVLSTEVHRQRIC